MAAIAFTVPMTPDPLARALDEAVAGRRGPLTDLLTRGSRLPGPRPNVALADAFAQACRARGAAADPVALALAGLGADEAPGATPHEFLPICGVAALSVRAAADASVRARFVDELHGKADDLRFRVRDAVIEGLSRIGGAGGEALAAEVSSWMDGYFHAAAVLRALAREPWLTTLKAPDAALARLDEGFLLARDAPRSAARYPGHKALMDALREAPPVFAVRFGVPVFDVLARWALVKDPTLRELVAGVLSEGKLAGRFRVELERVTKVLADTQPADRNPDHDFGPSRDRSGARARGQRTKRGTGRR